MGCLNDVKIDGVQWREELVFFAAPRAIAFCKIGADVAARPSGVAGVLRGDFRLEGRRPRRGERNSAGGRPVERERNWISAPRSALWSVGGDFPLCSGDIDICRDMI